MRNSSHPPSCGGLAGQIRTKLLPKPHSAALSKNPQQRPQILYLSGLYGILPLGKSGDPNGIRTRVTAVSGANGIRASGTTVFNASRNFVINSGASLTFAGGQNTIAGQISGGGQLGSGYVDDGNRLILTGSNSGFTGQYVLSGFIRADEGTGLSSNANLLFIGRNTSSVSAGILETNGSFTRSLGSEAGQVQWTGEASWGSGGFAAVGGALSVNLGGNVTPDTLTYGSGYFLPRGFLRFGSTQATHDVTFQNNVALNGANRTITVVANGTTKAIMSGALSGNASSGLIKTGDGTLVLAGNNTYAGVTNVTAGTLLINGSTSASSLVTVSSGATLGGNGTVGGTVTVNSGGTLAPGNSPGLLTVGSLVLEAGSTTAFEVAGTSARGTDYDAITVTSSNGLTLAGAFSINFTNIVALGNTTDIKLFDYTGSHSGDFSSLVASGFSDYAGTWTHVGQTFTKVTSGGQTLTFSELTGNLTVVPEPATWALLAFSLTTVLVLRRRRRD